MDIFARILVKDHLLDGIIKHFLAEILWGLGNLFLGFGRVNFRGWLDINLSLRGLRNSQGPPQDSVDSDEEPMIGA